MSSTDAIAERQQWMAVLALAEVSELSAAWEAWEEKPQASVAAVSDGTENDRFRHEHRRHRGDVDTPCRNPVPKPSCAETFHRPFSGKPVDW